MSHGMSGAAAEDLVAVLIADGVPASDAVNPAEVLAVIPEITVFRRVGEGCEAHFPGPFQLVAE